MAHSTPKVVAEVRGRLENEVRLLKGAARKMLEQTGGKPESARAIADIAQKLEDLTYDLGTYV